MLLKICEWILVSGDAGKRWHIFENVSRVVYDDFVQEIPDKETFAKLTSRYGYEAVHKILTSKGTEIYPKIYPMYLSFVEFLNREGKKELIVFDSCNAYLCDDKGNTISSFGCKVLQKKNPDIVVQSTKWMNKQEAEIFEKRIEAYEPPLKMEDAIKDLEKLCKIDSTYLLAVQPFTGAPIDPVSARRIQANVHAQ